MEYIFLTLHQWIRVYDKFYNNNLLYSDILYINKFFLYIYIQIFLEYETNKTNLH